MLTGGFEYAVNQHGHVIFQHFRQLSFALFGCCKPLSLVKSERAPVFSSFVCSCAFVHHLAKRLSSMPHNRDFPVGVWNILQINNPCHQGYSPEALKLVFGFGRVLRPLS